MQERLGHKSPSSTARYTHLTPPPLDVVHATIAARMADLSTRRSMAMPEGADGLQRYGADYRERFGEDLFLSIETGTI